MELLATPGPCGPKNWSKKSLSSGSSENGPGAMGAPCPRHLNRADVNDRRPDALGDADEGRLQRVGRALRWLDGDWLPDERGEDQRVNPKACAEKGEK